MSEENDLPSITEVAAKFTAPEMKGGTASDPNVDLPPVRTAEEKAPEESKVEVVAEDPKPVPPPEKKPDPTSSKFAALARREKAFREAEAASQARQREIEAREQALKDRESRWSSTKRPMEKLKELGISYGDLTQDLLGNWKEPTPDPLDEKLKPLKERWDKFEPGVEAMKQELAELKNALSARVQQEQYEKAMSSIKTVTQDAEKYELINAMGDEGLDLVRDTIVEYFNQHQKFLDYSEACDIVEKYYEDEYLGRLEKTKKLKTRLSPQESPKLSSAKPEVKTPKESRTLTSRQQTAPEVTKSIDDMSKQEAIEYLAKRLQFK